MNISFVLYYSLYFSYNKILVNSIIVICCLKWSYWNNAVEYFNMKVDYILWWTLFQSLYHSYKCRKKKISY